MALTYGFYNSIEGDRVYDAIQFGRIFDGIIKDGVYATYEKGMMVIASANPAEVIIQPGRAWFNHTWSYNDANVIFEAPAPEVLLERIDALVLEINEELSSRENSFKWVQGIPSSRPENPTLTNTSTIHQYPLCYVHRYPETTMIYTRDITNMIGTSECPFVTGVLEGIDLDAWINQWDNEFHNWENTKKTQFEAWMLAQETTFTTWYNAFKDQMAADVQEVEDFVDYLESVLDASTAVHLQEEIDELRDEISSGSYITVTTINPELYGRNVTITEAGGTVFTEKFDNTGVAEFKSVPYVGNLTISSTYGTQTAERVVNTPYYARYEFAIAFWAATVDIVGDPEMSGYSVTVKDSDQTIVGTVVLDSEGTGVYTAIKPDTYKFSITYGGETMEVTLSVTQETTYTVDLHAAGFKWQDWLEAGGVTGSYSSLDDVLADEVALRRLFTVHASVDYMASINDENEDVEKIIGTDLAAKWINNRDYALDTLYANEIIAGYMDTADKYFYGEWVLMPQVPKMTSATAPSGEVISDGTLYFENYAWKAFDRNEAGGYGTTTFTNTYIGYVFPSAVRIDAIKYLSHYDHPERGMKNFRVEYSLDGTANSWVSVYTGIGANTANYQTFEFDNNVSARYWRVYVIDTISTSGGFLSFLELQFYSWQPKGNVPVMTSNSAPYGTASNQSSQSGYEAYRAFDGDDSTYAIGSSTAGTSSGPYIAYKSSNPINVRRIYHKYSSGSITETIVVKYSDDGSTWTSTNVQYTIGNNEEKYVDIPDCGYHLYWGIFKVSSTSASKLYASSLQFYGRELSVSVPKMDTNTTPFGEAFASANTSYAYYAFDGDTTYAGHSNAWSGADGSTDNYVGYDFGKPVVLKSFSVNFWEVPTSVGLAEKTWKIQGYDGTSWNDITTITSPARAANAGGLSVNVKGNVSNNNAYIKYRIYSGDRISYSGSWSCAVDLLYLYCEDYSEKEFEEGATKKWLYDHGIELTDVTLRKGSASGCSYEKQPNQMLMVGSTGTNANTNFTMVGFGAEDLSNYSLVRAKIGNEYNIKNISNGDGSGFVVNTDMADFPNNGSYVSTHQVAYLAVTTSLLPSSLSINISNANQTAYVVFGCLYNSNNQRVTLSELWLE